MYTLITPPTEEPITLQEVKATLRIETDHDDTVLTAMLAAARTVVERRIDHAILTQDWSWRCDGRLDRTIAIRPVPLQTIESVTLTDENGDVTTLSPTAYQVSPGRPGHVHFVEPVPTIAPNGFATIAFTAGWAGPADVPQDLVRAIYLLTAHYYEQRELFQRERYVPVPLTVEHLLAPYREVRL